ncbi:cysteinyl-tRNA synthetase [Aneurinibacillus soli]|uniref:Cysteine--tRNA ligase n=1 Tax=Aneurinibacillus soli TaxID=1500254 RepID=A0A0U5BDB1_9BACL|nr:cysteine--tRNA ligase [Aneurinibacillus soli]PYE57668.1 cysteinyl-tRNA synthetase [Aneurinibacillus soli]BAU26142.1 Cysteine--tRNA ligase [Aneurinibacillus soli]
MSIKIYNTLTRKKEEFIPLESGKVKMYVCGPTVYNFIHIGNARPPIVFDVVRRYFAYRGYDVTYVQNFTDVDDKIIKKAEETGMTVKEVAETFIAAFKEDVRALSIQEATIHPKVTEHIPEIIEFVQGLIDKGHAYAAGGDVYFRTASFAEYGKLSQQNIEDLQAGARVEVNEKKESPLDFVLWKGAKPGEIYWESPWGEGRPGWHIECSAMSKKYLGDTFDIHGGGHDLTFPHHENEIAQSECLTGHVMARYWMHNGFINIENEKMSKSLGNFILVKDIREQYPARVVRFFLLSAHYRNPVNFSKDLIQQATNSLERIDTAVRNLKHRLDSAVAGTMDAEEQAKLNAFRGRFVEEMDNDFNTADAITVLFDMVREANRLIASEDATKAVLEAYLALFTEFGDVLGIAFGESDVVAEGPSDEGIDALIVERGQARKDRNFVRADEIRNQLQELGIVLEDTPQGVRWHRK